MAKLYYEDIEIGMSYTFGAYELKRDEIIEYALKWDPQPFHVDEEAAKDSIFGEITACAAHLFAISSVLFTHENPRPIKLLAGLGMEEYRLITPGKVGDRLSCYIEFTKKRRSQKNPDRAIVTMRNSLLNQRNEVIMDQISNVLIGCRQEGV